MLLTWYFARSEIKDEDNNGELELTPEIIDEFQTDLERLNIQLDFYSGPWDSLHEVGAFERSGTQGNIVLTSETVYSIEYLPSLVETLERACSKSIEANLKEASLTETGKEGESKQDICLVAAKVLYFGVGGGVNAFNDQLTQKNARSKTVWKSDRGVARVVLQVMFP